MFGPTCPRREVFIQGPAAQRREEDTHRALLPQLLSEGDKARGAPHGNADDLSAE